MTEPPRLAFHGAMTRHRAIAHSGWSRVTDANASPLGPHRHDGAYEVCLIVSGEVDWWVGEEVHTVGPGQVYVTRPGEVHGGVGEVIHPAEFYWCGLTLPGPRGAWGLSVGDVRTLTDHFAGMTRRVFAAEPALPAAFGRLIQAMKGDSARADWRVRAAALDLVVTTLSSHDAERATRSPSREIRRVMDWMNRHLDEPLAIRSLADRAGLAVSRFHERFVEETGYSPGDWRNRRRIAEAKRWLRGTDRSVTQIAMETGFGSSQYFATAFRRQVGVSPSAYRRQAAGAGRRAGEDLSGNKY
ncbi:MAG: AraC family transcriptional regulator [Planctomycetota bacterium]